MRACTTAATLGGMQRDRTMCACLFRRLRLRLSAPVPTAVRLLSTIPSYSVTVPVTRRSVLAKASIGKSRKAEYNVSAV